MNILKRVFCRHKKVLCVGNMITGGENNHYKQEYIFEVVFK